MSQLSPKEKAIELIERYQHYFPLMLHKEKTNPDVKACALICVNEMIFENHSLYSYAVTHQDARALVIIGERIKYLEQVKTEIQNL